MNCLIPREIDIHDLVFTRKRKGRFQINLSQRPDEQTGNNRHLDQAMSLKMVLRSRNRILNLGKSEETAKENRGAEGNNTNKKRRVKLSLKQSWFNSEKVINKDVCEIIRRIYTYYNGMFDQKISVIDDFKKMRIFTRKDRENHMHKR